MNFASADKGLLVLSYTPVRIDEIVVGSAGLTCLVKGLTIYR